MLASFMKETSNRAPLNNLTDMNVNVYAWKDGSGLAIYMFYVHQIMLKVKVVYVFDVM
jgi:hypothetical protein